MESVNNQTTIGPNVAMDGEHDKDTTKDDPKTDPQKLKRIMASREYSRKYRMKQLQYILNLEMEVKALQAEVEIAAPRIKYVSQQNTLLRIENRCLKQRLSTYSSELMFREAQYGELQREREVLKQIYVVKRHPPAEDDTNESSNC